MLFSIVIPCYNEEENIEKLTTLVDQIDHKYDFEVILVNNGSKDNTYHKILEASEKNNRIVPLNLVVNQGYGNGILYGLKHTKGEYIGWSHADLQIDIREFEKIFRLIESNNYPKDVFIKGNRTGRSFIDIIFTFFMSVFETILFFKILNDINAQPNMFHKTFMKHWNNPPKDFSLDLFVYYLAKKMKYKIIRFKTRMRKRIHGKSSWNSNIFSRVKFINRTIKYSFGLKWGKKNDFYKS